MISLTLYLQLSTCNCNLSFSDPDSIINSFSTALNNTLDKHAPLKLRTFIDRHNSKFYTPDCRAQKRKKRACERKLDKAKLQHLDTFELSLEHKNICHEYKALLDSAKELHFQTFF